MKPSIAFLLLVALGVSCEKLDLRGKQVWQTTTYRSFGPRLAVDGIGDCESYGFSHTVEATNPWWQVDLGGLYVIEKVKVRPLKHLDMPIEVYISKRGGDGSYDNKCGNRLTVTGNHLDQFTCGKDIESKMVTVYRPTHSGYPKPLALCDVEVFARRRQLDCGVPTYNLHNGHVTYSGTTENHQARYSCNQGYRINGADVWTCRKNRRGRPRWMASGKKPTCSIVQCNDPQDPENGYHEQTRYTYDSLITYKCNRGHTISGEASSRCTAEGQWSHPPPTCRPIRCPDPGTPHYGKRHGDNFLFDSDVAFSCDEGYKLQGPDRIRCGVNGRWSESLPHCYAITCTSLNAPMNGHVEAGSGFTIGSTRHYACDLGHTLIGSKSINCEEENGRGVWSGSVPTCRKMSCGPPSHLENGQILGNVYTFGSTLLYSCGRGYQLEGPNRRMCLVNGWGGSEPKCNPITCRDPGAPTNGKRSNGSITFGSVMTYSCDTGYILKGSATSTCGVDGLWSNRKPECEPVKCDPIHIPTHGSKDGDVFEFPKTITFSCFPGYSLQGSSSTSCQEDGTWSDPSPYCKACDVGFYKESVGNHSCTMCPENSITVTTASTRKEHCSCVPGTAGPLGGPCRVVSCEQLSAPENGRISDCSNDQGSECTFTCNRGYTRSGGVARRVCTETGWTGNPVSCTACPADSYTMFHGADTCTPCPRHTETAPDTVGRSVQSCLCKSGFYGPQGGPCEDFDECIVNPCNGTCVNTVGSFKCRCDTPGYVLAEDEKTCIMNETCKALTDKPSHGSLSCRYTAHTNGHVCYIQCNPGYFFVSGINDYIICGKETLFEWSHRLVNITARIPSCTREHFVDVDMPVTAKYTYNETCSDWSARNTSFSDHLDQVVNSISTCNDKCSVHKVKTECTDKVTGGCELKVTFKMMLTNVRPNEVPYNCATRCKQQNMREILVSMRDLSVAFKELSKDSPTRFELEVENTPKLISDSLVYSRPTLLCEDGHVFTQNRLCVPCDRGHYLPSRENKTCIPCPKGKYQENVGQTTCKQCLPGSTTMGTGSDHPTMCSERMVSFVTDSTVEK